MKLTLEHRDIRPTEMVNGWVKKQITSLEKRLRIDEARILLVHRAEASPAYAAQVHLVVPGPDLQAEAEDHTLRAALAKAMARLRDKLVLRSAKRRQRRAGGLCRPARPCSAKSGPRS